MLFFFFFFFFFFYFLTEITQNKRAGVWSVMLQNCSAIRVRCTLSERYACPPLSINQCCRVQWPMKHELIPEVGHVRKRFRCDNFENLENWNSYKRLWQFKAIRVDALKTFELVFYRRYSAVDVFSVSNSKIFEQFKSNRSNRYHALQSRLNKVPPNLIYSGTSMLL